MEMEKPDAETYCLNHGYETPNAIELPVVRGRCAQDIRDKEEAAAAIDKLHAQAKKALKRRSKSDA